jgi:hypothetical protein
MSLYFITGKIGAGKSYLGIKTIVDELVKGRRLVVTNLSVKLPELADYLADVHSSLDISLYDHWMPATEFQYLAGAFAPGIVGKMVDGQPMVFVPSRVRLLDDGQLREFYRYRQVAAGLVPKVNEKEAGDKGPSNPVCLNFSAWGRGGAFAGQGVVYLLDECQLFYNVRKYAEAPNEMPFYMSQHRKLGDDIYCLTQKPENVDKMFRSFTQEYLYLTNVGKRKIGIFQPPRFFRMSAYADMFTGSTAQVADWSRSFRMDFRLADCYETGKGIGIEAQKADKDAPSRGISWKWALLFPVFLASLFPVYGVVSKHLVHSVIGQSADALAAVGHQTNHFTGGRELRGGAGSVNDPSAIFAASAGASSPSPVERQSSRVMPTPPPLDPRTVAQAVYAASESVPTVSRDVSFVGVWTTPDPSGRLVTTVALSDRSVYVLGVDKELTSVTPKYCIIGGVMYVWRSYSDLAREAVTPSYPSFNKAGAVVAPAAAPRPGGVLVGGFNHQ